MANAILRSVPDDIRDAGLMGWWTGFLARAYQLEVQLRGRLLSTCHFFLQGPGTGTAHVLVSTMSFVSTVCACQKVPHPYAVPTSGIEICDSMDGSFLYVS